MKVDGENNVLFLMSGRVVLFDENMDYWNNTVIGN
jgi:hypothetical protein